MKQTSNSFSTNENTHKHPSNSQHQFFNHRNQVEMNTRLSQEENRLKQFKINLLKTQQKIICEQIQKYQHKNLQKLFPPLLKQLKSKSQKLMQIQNKLNQLKCMNSRDLQKQEEQKQILGEQIQILEQKELIGTQEELLRNQYEKELIVGIIDSTEIRIRQIIQQKQTLHQQKSVLQQKKLTFQKQVLQQKQMIIKLNIAKNKILQQINYVKNCEIQPIHLIHQKELKIFQYKASSLAEGLMLECCNQLDQLTMKQFQNYDQQDLRNQNILLSDSQANQIRVQQMKDKLKYFTEKKLQKNNEIETQFIKKQILLQQIAQKQEQIDKYQNLSKYVQAQSFYAQTYDSQQTLNNQNIPRVQVVNVGQLEMKVQNQNVQNQKLALKLQQLLEKVNDHHSTFQDLTQILQKYKRQNEIKTKKLIVQNNVLKNNLEEKKRTYDNSVKNNELLYPKKQHSLAQVPAKNRIQNINKQQIYIQRTILKKADMNSTQNMAQKTSHPKVLAQSLQTKKLDTQTPQNLSLKLKQLRIRLQAKFQAQRMLKS